MAKNTISLLIIALLPLLLWSQEDDKATRKLPEIRENVVLHTDRDIYFAGEKIWFSATRNVNNWLPDKEFSKILYIELCDPDRVQHVLSKNTIEHNRADGVIDIPEDLVTGYYLLRAYTNYQRNEGPESFATLMLAIVNPSVPPVLSGINSNDLTEVFVIKDTDPHTHRYGLLIPRKYAQSQNITLRIEEKDLRYPVRHFRNGLAYFQTDTLLSGSMAELSMILHHDTIVEKLTLPEYPAVSLDVASKGNSLEFRALKNKTDLSLRGNIVLSIMDEQFQQVHQEQIALREEITKWSVSPAGLWPGEKVNLEIDFGNDYGKVNNFDVSVVKKGSTYRDNELPVFLIRNPHLLAGYLSTHPSADKMLTDQLEILLSAYAQQAREAEKEATMPDGTGDNYYVESRGVRLSGLVQIKSTGKPAARATVYMSVFGDQPQLQVYTTADDGNFRFALRHVNDLVNVYLVAKNDSLDELEILVSADHDARFPEFHPADFVPDSALRSFLDEAYINAQVEENYLHSLLKTTPIHHALRFNEPEVLSDFDDYIELQDLEASLNEIVPYVKVKRKNRQPYLEVLDGITNLPYDNPLILLDNLPVFDIGELLAIHPSRIKTVEVINSTYIYGDQVLKGIVMITTKTDNFGGYALPESFTTLEYQSAASPVRFIQPYDDDSGTRNDRFPDFRNTLFQAAAGEPEKAANNFTFFTSDHVGSYNVIVHGHTQEGKIFMTSAEFSVR
ncbi:MAG: hypothetical protein P8100_04365 [bacterium]